MLRDALNRLLGRRPIEVKRPARNYNHFIRDIAAQAQVSLYRLPGDEVRMPWVTHLWAGLPFPELVVRGASAAEALGRLGEVISLLQWQPGDDFDLSRIAAERPGWAGLVERREPCRREMEPDLIGLYGSGAGRSRPDV
jgi:hypothetical protein